jgi:hypothetical protein
MKPISRTSIARIQDRRRRRTSQVIEALHLQLDACRAEAELTALVVTDQTGICLASSGSPGTSAEVAARLPLLDRAAGDYEGVLMGAKGAVPVSLKRFDVDGSQMYACAVGGDARRHAAQLVRAELGVKRILAA